MTGRVSPVPKGEELRALGTVPIELLRTEQVSAQMLIKQRYYTRYTGCPCFVGYRTEIAYSRYWSGFLHVSGVLHDFFLEYRW